MAVTLSDRPIPVVVINQTANNVPIAGAVTQSGAPWSVTVSGSVAVTGTFWQATQPVSIAGAVAVTGTFWQATQPVSAASLPLPSGASTSAKQPALGTAGTSSADVLSVQGIASMTALKVDPSGVTSPVSIASPSNLATSQVSIGITATLIAASRAGRLGIVIENLGAVDIFIGGAGVTITTGMLLRGVAGTAVSMLFNGAIYGIVAVGTQSVSVAEVY